MSKKRIVVLIVFCVLFALLLVGTVVGTAALFLFGNTQGLVGELLSNAELPPLFEKLDPPKQTEHVPETDGIPSESTGDLIEIDPFPLETLPPDINIEIGMDEEKPLPDEMYDYFDFDMAQIPLYTGFSRVRRGMRLELVINMMGKPHRYIHLTDESVMLLWNTDTDEAVMVKATFGQGEYPTEEDRWNDARVTDVFR